LEDKTEIYIYKANHLERNLVMMNLIRHCANCISSKSNWFLRLILRH